MHKIPAIADDQFWSPNNWTSAIESDLAKDLVRTRSILAPHHVDTRIRSTLPVSIFQAGPFEEFRFGNLADDGYVAAVDQDRNTLRICAINQKSDAPAGARRKGPRQPGLAIHTVQSSGLDLGSRCHLDLSSSISRYRVMAILPLAATDAAVVQVGGDPATFDQDLSAALGTIQDRQEIPPEFLAETHPWKALAAPPSLAPGLRATVAHSSGRDLLDVEFALPELRGERLHLEPGAVLPSGHRPPDAVKRIHVLAAGEEFLQSAQVLLPAFAGGADGLLRGHASIDLGLLLPNVDRTEIQSVYLFSGDGSVGPLEFPALTTP